MTSLYFALYDGDMCACGMDESFLGSDKPEGSCTMPCVGNSSISCGGKEVYDLYEVSGYGHSSML